MSVIQQMVAPHRRPYPSKLFVEVTTRCNLRCAMCVKQAPGQGLVDGDMTRQTFALLAPAFPHLEALVLNGIGEPMLHRGLEEFIGLAKAAMPSSGWVGFQTNGQLIGPRRAESLVAAGVDRICISADAVAPDQLRALHGGAQIGAIESAAGWLHGAADRLGRSVSLGLEFVAMRGNLGQLPELITWAASHGFDFLIVSHMLPYDAAMAGEAAFSPTSDRALQIYRTWRDRAAAEGVTFERYLDTFMQISPSPADARATHFVQSMVADATSQGVFLNVAAVLRFDERRLQDVEDSFARAKEIAQQLGLDLRLPNAVPTHVRRCEFVEDGSAFVSWAGDLHPCYFLWHRFQCHLAGLVKMVQPRIFGNVASQGILETWNADEWRAFRGDVTAYDFPFCYDCNLAMCNYVGDGDFEQDCHLGKVPCAACLWCTGLFQCLR
ncbi:MAG TPA: radical SAM/SPASM family putative metalloenzyme maturase [Patescibacteria group bacterium]|nr:radical SAM/SPASM family putative metalloenzyme maturase [Patescibacteria group bacterium]